MELEIRMMSKEEKMYVYTQSAQIAGQTGFIGYLRADMDTDGNGFFSTWNDNTNNPKNKTEEFKKEFDEVINTLRFDDSYGSIHEKRKRLNKFCWSKRKMRMSDNRDELCRSCKYRKVCYMMD